MKKKNNSFLKFSKSSIAGIVTCLGDKKIIFNDNYKKMGLTKKDALKLSTNLGLKQRYIVSGNQTISDLCYKSSIKLFKGLNIKPDEIDAVILVSQTTDYETPSTAIKLQNKLGIKNKSICFDINLGCSGFVYGLCMSYSLIDSGLKKVLLCVGDVASKIINPTDHTIAPIMGDAGSSILVERKKSNSYFQLYSDGSGENALKMKKKFINNKDITKEYLKMDGAAVFGFSIKQVPYMIRKILKDTNISQNKIDYFVLHQPNKFMLEEIIKKLELKKNKVPHQTQSYFGNQNSASIPGTINGFLNEDFKNLKLKLLFGGFGVGLSWGAALVETNKIFCPKPILLRN